MFPVRDDNPTFLTPYTTYALVVANAMAWYWVQGLGTEPALSASVCTLGLTPGDLLGTLPVGSAHPLSEGMACVIAEGAAWHTLFTSMFMHGGWFHIVGNMWFLWIFGNNVEDAMGHLRFLVFYLLGGLAAAALQLASDPSSGLPMVGASGAIGAVMGAYVILYPRVHVHLLLLLVIFPVRVAVPAFFMLGYWLLIQVLGGFTSIGAAGGGVAFWAHVGGFVAGSLLVLVFRDQEMLARHPYAGWRRRRLPTQSWHRIG